MPRSTTVSRPLSFVAAAVFLLLATPISAQAQATPAADTTLAARLIGTWTVDLRPTADAPAYEKEFVIETVTGNTFTGRFYDTPIEHGMINTAWGDAHLAFVSSDGIGVYNHSSVLRGGKMVGQSQSLGRSFLLVWRAAPKM